MTKKLRAAIIGPGNIGTDLLMKASRSDLIEPYWMVGVIPSSPGLARAKTMGLKTTAEGVDGMVDFIEEDEISFAFDATSAYVHAENSRKVNEKGVLMIDMTPAAIGPFCIPPVNIEEQVSARSMNVNLVTCGGQATIPIVAAVSRVQEVSYGEIIATVASESIGVGTRQNIDEFTRTTAKAVEKVGGAKKGKAIIIVNPADPPLMMRDTIHCKTVGKPNQEKIIESVHAMVAEVQKYVPGYRLKNGPVFDGNYVTIWMEVEGLGDFLPKYAGNLDIMTSAGLRIAEMFAEKINAGEMELKPVIQA